MGKVVWTIRKVYDALAGESIREIMTNDIVTLTAYIKSGTLIASTIGMSNYILYPYIFRAEPKATTPASYVALMLNTSTIALIGIQHSKFNQIITDPDKNPICKIAASSTIKLKLAASATASATLIMKRVPVNTKVNTG